jgi:hypothetical protein
VCTCVCVVCCYGNVLVSVVGCVCSVWCTVCVVCCYGNVLVSVVGCVLVCVWCVCVCGVCVCAMLLW